MLQTFVVCLDPVPYRDGGLVIVRHEAEIATSALKKPAGTVHQPNLQVGIKQTKLSISRGLRAGNRMQCACCELSSAINIDIPYFPRKT